MTEEEAAAQSRIRELAERLEEVDAGLEAVHASVPVSAMEALMLVGEAELDVATELRSVIECVRNDRILPAIRELQAAADYRPGEGRK